MSVRGLFASICAILALTIVNGIQAKGQSPLARESVTVASRVIEPIDESARFVLKGTVHPLANAANDRGEAPESLPLQRIHMLLRRSDSQEQALHELIQEMHTPGSANYHKWLTPEQFGNQFGPSDQDISTVESWLQSHGFAVKQVNPGKLTLEFSGNAGQFRETFHTAIHSYQVNGKTHYANAGEPDIPAALKPVIGGFVSLNNFPVRSGATVLGTASVQPNTHQAKPEWTDGSSYGLVVAPADLAVQYDLNPLYQSGVNGTGQSVAVISDSNINVTQANQFRSMFGLPANPPQVVIDGYDPGIGGVNDTIPHDDLTEAYLDVEWVGALAPNATVYLVIAGDEANESGLYLAAEHAVYSNIAPVISFSFGDCEKNLGAGNAFFNNLWEQAAAQGITVVVPAGDSGSAGCDFNEYDVSGLGVNGMASTPYDVAVGGTDFYYSFYQNPTVSAFGTYWNTTATQLPQASLLQVIPEQPWNASQYGLNVNAIPNGVSTVLGGGGGASSCSTGTTSGGYTYTSCTAGYAKPSWQTGTGVPADNARDLPDVSLFASSGANNSYYPICVNDGDCQTPTGSNPVQITSVGGTSVAASAFAGVMALVNQKYGRQGQADATLYPLKTQYPAAFHDVTIGTNSQPCNITTATSTSGTYPPLNCIAVANPFTVVDSTFGAATEGELGTGTTAAYNAAPGYNLATGLGTIDANQMLTLWGNVKFAATQTTLAPSSTAFTHGTPITISGTVTAASGTPTGQVALMTDSTTPLQGGLTSFTLASGAYSSSSIVDLPGGTYNIWGQYSGDSQNAPSTSTKTSVTVTPESSILSLSIAPYGSSAPLTAIPYGVEMSATGKVIGNSCTANCTIPTGTVTLLAGTTPVYNLVLDTTGTAQFQTSAVPVGSYTVSASYSGDASYSASTSSAYNGTSASYNLTVVKDTPTVQLSINGSATAQGVVGVPTVLTIQVINSNYYSQTGAAPTGVVTLSGAPAGVPTTATLAGTLSSNGQYTEGVATIVFPATVAAGSYPVTLSYPGDTNYTTATGTMTVTLAAGTGLASTITATASPTSTSPLAAIPVTGVVTGQSSSVAPSGTVTVYSNGVSIYPVSLNPPTSGYTTSFTYMANSDALLPGTNLLTLVYSGDKNYKPATSTLTLTNSNSDFTLTSQPSTVSVVAGGSNATGTIYVGSAYGFTGAVNLTCTAPTGVTCVIPSSTTLTAGGSTGLTLTLSVPVSTSSGTYNVLITGSNSTGTNKHTLNIQAVVKNTGKGVITSPVPGSTLTGASTTFTWNAGSGATGYYLWVGTTLGGSNLINVGPQTGTSKTVTLPTSGATIYVRLWTVLNGTLVSNDYTYTESTQAAATMTSPASGSTLTGASTTFTWSTSSSGVTGYYLWVGTTSGGSNLANIGPLTSTSATITLPTSGATIYVRLWTVLNGTLVHNDYTYTEASQGAATAAAITSPSPGSTLTGASTTFTWTAGTGGVTGYYLWVGTTSGGSNLVNIGPLTGTSATVTLPTNGATLYVRLWTVLNGSTLVYNNYTYTAFP
jgi:subtilase family serine protease